MSADPRPSVTVERLALLERVRALYEDLAYERCLSTLDTEKATLEEGHGAEAEVALLTYEALCASQLRQEGRARAALGEALAMDPALTLPLIAPPRLRALLAELREAPPGASSSQTGATASDAPVRPATQGAERALDVSSRSPVLLPETGERFDAVRSGIRWGSGAGAAAGLLAGVGLLVRAHERANAANAEEFEHRALLLAEEAERAQRWSMGLLTGALALGVTFAVNELWPRTTSSRSGGSPRFERLDRAESSRSPASAVRTRDSRAR